MAIRSTINWDAVLEETEGIEVQDSFEPIPNGNYEASILEAKATTASTGNEMIVVTFVLTEEGPFKNRRVWTNLVFAVNNPKAMALLLKRLTALGLSRAWISEHRPSVAQIASKIEGAEALLTIGQHTYEEKVRNDVNGIKPLPTAKKDSMDDEYDDDVPAAPAKSRRPAPTDADDDDMEFSPPARQRSF
jgi:hypothetical protein